MMGKKTNNNARKKKKLNLVFDGDKRKEFLCGFRKRKLERKKKAQDELKQMLKDEKKRIKQENKESYKKLVLSSKPIPDLEQILQDEYEDEDVNVKIVELSTDTMQKKDLCIGDNRPTETVSDKKKEKSKNNSAVPGMDMEAPPEESTSEPEDELESTGKTKKEIKQMLKKQATKKLQKSKVFQMKSKLDRIQNKKKSHSKKQGKIKSQKGKGKEKGKHNFGKKKH